ITGIITSRITTSAFQPSSFSRASRPFHATRTSNPSSVNTSPRVSRRVGSSSTTRTRLAPTVAVPRGLLGQRHAECGAFSITGALDGDVAAVTGDDLARDEQPKAEAWDADRVVAA